MLNILSNLLHNAVKFTKEGFISVDVYEEIVAGIKYAVISVSDTGIGISVDDQKVIFEEFRQAGEGMNRPFEGTGLGLTLSKKFITLLNGFLSLKSAPGIGSKFYVYLPSKTTNEIPDTINPADNSNDSYSAECTDAPSLSLPKILLVENEESILYLTKILLKNICKLDTANNAQSALFLTERMNYDLILMDINLGDIVDGTYLTRVLRNNSKYKDTPIIAFTAYALDSEKEEFLSAGFSDFISKPFTRAELHNKIEINLKKVVRN